MTEETPLAMSQKLIKENWTARLRFLIPPRKLKFFKGKLLLEPAEDVPVNSLNQWKLTFIAGGTIRAPATFRLQLNNSLGANWAFEKLQTDSPAEEGYVRALINAEKIVPELTRQNLIEIKLKGNLKKNSRIVIIFGDKSGGSPGARMKIYTGVIRFFASLIDAKGKIKLLKDFPILRVLPERAARLACKAPSIIRPTERFAISLEAFDRFGNITSADGTVRIKSRPPLESAPEDVIFYENERHSKDFSVSVGAATEGRLRIEVQSENLGGKSNPCIITREENPERIFWGEIHGHSMFSDGLEDPDFYYEYARDVEKLDFCALTDHDTWLDKAKWEIIKYVTSKYYEPGRFVTLLGFEWSSAQHWTPPDKTFGHKCVYFPGESADYFNHLDPKYDTPEKLWRAIKKTGAITVGHHPAYPLTLDGKSFWGTDWAHHDDRFEPLYEIYSKHGLSEEPSEEYKLFAEEKSSFTIEALKRGHRFGFTGGSDTHISRPGSDMQEGRRGIRHPRSGLTAVFAKELTRAAIFESLKKRRCYATTGARIILKFSLGKVGMGGVAKNPEKRVFSILAIGTEKIGKVEIIKNGEVAHSFSPEGDEASFTWEDSPGESRKDSPADFYYLRIRQIDRHIGWSSPIWVE